MIKNYIWDFDGMLFDSYPHIATAFKKALADDGIDIDYNEAKKLLEVTYATAYEYYNVTEEQKARFHAYENDFDLEPKAVPFKNTVETIRRIAENGGRNFLYTHRGETAFYYLKKFGICDYFEYFVTNEMGFPLKPAPDAVEHIVTRFSLDKSETVMIGDREIDVLSGKNAGTLGCLFTLEEKETKADFVVDDIIKILDLE